MFFKTGVPKNFEGKNFHRKIPVLEPLLIKSQASRTLFLQKTSGDYYCISVLPMDALPFQVSVFEKTTL